MPPQAIEKKVQLAAPIANVDDSKPIQDRRWNVLFIDDTMEVKTYRDVLAMLKAKALDIANANVVISNQNGIKQAMEEVMPELAPKPAEN